MQYYVVSSVAAAFVSTHQAHLVLTLSLCVSLSVCVCGHNSPIMMLDDAVMYKILQFAFGNTNGNSGPFHL